MKESDDAMVKNQIVSKSRCCGCSACYNICPQQAISMVFDDEGFLYPVINEQKCIDCSACVRVCPVKNGVEKYEYPVRAYAAYSNDEIRRMNSSSGGVFPAIAEYVLSQNGVVFGAAFNKDYQVVHTKIDSISELYKLQGSKYVQSLLGKVFLLVKIELISKKMVLFSGTPCQIEGLKKFLGKEYSNLYTIDLICHGVPSPKLWETYLDEEYGISNITNIRFRNKKHGWENFDLTIETKNHIQHEASDISIYKEDFLQGFLKNLYLRPSCHNCSFKGMKHSSDITLGDLWGGRVICPQFIKDDKGMSVVFVQSSKGKFLLNQLESKLIFNEVPLNEVINHNLAMIQSETPHPDRELFFKDLNSYNRSSIKKMIKKYIGPTLRKRISVYLRNKLSIKYKRK